MLSWYFRTREIVNPFRTAVPFLGDKTLKFQVVCLRNGTAVLKGLNVLLDDSVKCEMHFVFCRATKGCRTPPPRAVLLYWYDVPGII